MTTCALGHTTVVVVQGARRDHLHHELEELACEEPLYTLPVGWERMSRDELDRWAITRQAGKGQGVAARYVHVGHADASCSVEVPAEPKGDVVPGLLPTSRSGCYSAGTDCPMCGEGLVEDSWYAAEPHCLDCGFSVVDIEYLPTVEADPAIYRGSGAPVPYRDNELAAQTVVYFQGEPVMGEPEDITGEEFPYSWDVPVVEQRKYAPVFP